MSWTRGAVFTVGIMLAVVVLPATQSRGLAQPANENAAKAFAILETNCANAGCHGGPGYYRFDVRDPLTLRDARLIRPGDAGESEVIRRVESGGMPLGGYKGQPGVKLPAEDIAVLRRWIDAGAAAVSAPHYDKRPFIPEGLVLAAIVSDLEAAQATDRPFLRYFSFSNIWNRTDVTESDLATYPPALSKLIHHLSWERAITPPKPVGPENTLLRIDLRDYGWTNQTWFQIEAAYPYAITNKGFEPQIDDIEKLSDASIPYLRVDWFLTNGSIAPLYHEILRLPETLSGLEKLLRIDSAADIAVGRARRFGLRNSAVSRNNRAIERTPTAFGSYWKSFDFASSRLDQNIFVDPLNLHPDGGEVIFTLPNGLQGYFIVDKNGRRINDAPVSIVRDRANAEDPVVHNGRSCIGCHVQGINAFRDEISAALKTRAGAIFDLPRAESLYRGQEELDRFLAEDNRVFNEALLRTGNRSSNQEPIRRLASLYEAPLTLAHAAADLFVDDERLQRVIVTSPELQRRGYDQLLGSVGGIKRDTWEQGFRHLLDEIDTHPPDNSRIQLPAIVLSTNLGTDATNRSGDAVEISVTVSADSFLALFSVDSAGSLRQLYPTVNGPQTRIHANQPVRIVDSTAGPTRVFGVETLIGVASANLIPLENHSGWGSFAASLRAWASSSSTPKRAGDQEITLLRYLRAP